MLLSTTTKSDKAPPIQGKVVPGRVSLFVALCCNDDLGNLSTLTQVQFGDLLHLHGDLDDGEEISLAPHSGAVFVNQVYYPISGLRAWIGNPYWSGANMRLAVAARLLNSLLELPHWQVVEGIAALHHACSQRTKLTADDLGRWL